jgi:acetyl-CoA C-acetyltransferase
LCREREILVLEVVDGATVVLIYWNSRVRRRFPMGRSDRRVALVGGGFTRPARYRYENAEECIAESFRDLMLKTPSLSPDDVEGLVMSYFSDHLNQQLCMGWIVQDYLGQHHKPGFRVEAGGSTPMDAIINAVYWIETGRYDVVLVPGWEFMSEVDTPTTNEFIAAASDTDWDFTVGGYYNGYYAALETRRMYLFGETIEDFGRVAIKARNNAIHNHFSQWREESRKWREEQGRDHVTIED